MQKRIEQYLKHATRGLWGQKRQQVKQELYSHIFERMHFHMAFGKTEEQALQEALESLGSSREVNRGLVRVHALPAAGKAFLLAGLIGGALISQAQQMSLVDVVTREKVCTGHTCDARPVSYLDPTALVHGLRDQGLKVEFRLGPDSKGATLHFPGMSPIWFGGSALFQQDGKIYLSLDTLMTMLSVQSGFHMKFLRNPEFQLQNTTFRLGNDQQPFDATHIYNTLIYPSLFGATQGALISPSALPDVPRYSVGLNVKDAQDGEVYALVQQAPGQRYNPEIYAQGIVVQYAEAQNGQVQFNSLTPDLHWTSLQNLQKGAVLLKVRSEVNNWQNVPPFDVLLPGTIKLQK